VIISVLLTAIASGIIRAIFSFLGHFLSIWIGGSIASAIVEPFLAIALTLMYFHLRDVAPTEVPVAAAPAAPEPATAPARKPFPPPEEPPAPAEEPAAPDEPPAAPTQDT
jgi:hypothetical protein